MSSTHRVFPNETVLELLWKGMARKMLDFSGPHLGMGIVSIAPSRSFAGFLKGERDEK